MKKILTPLFIGKIIIFLFGIFSIVAAFVAKNQNYFDHIILGTILMVSTLFELLETTIYKSKNLIHWLKICLEIIALFIAIFYFFPAVCDLNIKVLIIFWGFFDITTSILELLHLVLNTKEKRPSCYILIASSIIRLIFGIILIIKIEKGLFIHLIVVGIILMIKNTLGIINLIQEQK